MFSVYVSVFSTCTGFCGLRCMYAWERGSTSFPAAVLWNIGMSFA
jgi:hypothetical protein